MEKESVPLFSLTVSIVTVLVLVFFVYRHFSKNRKSSEVKPSVINLILGMIMILFGIVIAVGLLTEITELDKKHYINHLIVLFLLGVLPIYFGSKQCILVVKQRLNGSKLSAIKKTARSASGAQSDVSSYSHQINTNESIYTSESSEEPLRPNSSGSPQKESAVTGEDRSKSSPDLVIVIILLVVAWKFGLVSELPSGGPELGAKLGLFVGLVVGVSMFWRYFGTIAGIIALAGAIFALFKTQY